MSGFRKRGIVVPADPLAELECAVKLLAGVPEHAAGVYLIAPFKQPQATLLPIDDGPDVWTFERSTFECLRRPSEVPKPGTAWNAPKFRSHRSPLTASTARSDLRHPPIQRGEIAPSRQDGLRRGVTTLCQHLVKAVVG